jgi:hypothetical protein
MLVDQRAHGANIFHGVKNTTHITQEIDENHGMFKSDVRRNIHVLTNDLVTYFNLRQSLFDLDRENNRHPRLCLSAASIMALYSQVVKQTQQEAYPILILHSIMST